MTHASSTDLLVLHGVRIKGMANAETVSRRFSLDRTVVEEMLLDYEAFGWVQRVGFSGLEGWALTESGHGENAARLAAELDEAGAREAVAEGHAAFLMVNTRFLEAITKWQIRPTPWDPMASNEHDDWRWDERVLGELAGLARRLQPVGDALTESLARFAGYPERFRGALDRVDQGQRRWVDEPGIDSCHTVWFELHEDLLSTLGLDRSAEPAPDGDPTAAAARAADSPAAR
jgi:hypothetical protein